MTSLSNYAVIAHLHNKSPNCLHWGTDFINVLDIVQVK